MQLFTSNGTPVQLGEMLGSGGEGWIYEVNNHPTRTSLVAKVFFSPEKAAQKEAKLRYMVQNPPESIEQNGHPFLAWPLELLFDEQGRFTGFLMPKARGVELEYLCSDDFESYPEFQSTEWHKFYFSNPTVAGYRLRTAFNICAAVHAVHAKGYVIGDLKPGNVLLQPNGLVTLIDLDSIQITGPQESYPAAVLTPENAPPESKDMTAEDFKNESWDRFSLAVMLYRFLTGIHPFTGTLKPPYDTLNTYEELIRHGFYPHGSRKDRFEVIPPTHRRLFALYPPAIAQTFGQAFDTGLFQPDKRPSALEWNRILHEVLKAAASTARKVPSPFIGIPLTGKQLVITMGVMLLLLLAFNSSLPVPFRLMPTPWLLKISILSVYALAVSAMTIFALPLTVNTHTQMLIIPPLMTPSLLYLLSTHDQLPDDLGTPIIIHVGYIAFFLGIIGHLYDILQHKQELIQEKDYPESIDKLDDILLGRAVILFTTLAIPYYVYYYIHSDLEYSLYVVFTQEVALRKLIYFLAYTPWLLLKAIVVSIIIMIAGFIIYGAFAMVTIIPFARMLSIPEDYQNLVPLNFNIRTFKLLGITFFFAAVSACLLYVVTYGILAHIEELPPLTFVTIISYFLLTLCCQGISFQLVKSYAPLSFSEEFVLRNIILIASTAGFLGACTHYVMPQFYELGTLRALYLLVIIPSLPFWIHKYLRNLIGW
ncbi:MAG: hypothetical protein KatS3mg033_0680 [Thermonema sp.]|uniref:protein kinase domain-containing protein n=1 Tax=Thermonema sp. TaxID=2231181 RepID=UPI0021DD0190|nr:hypothetical protein [Thermonema sp.]GIV38880.1 MAG: hypothetical protein KatS3mg033_0680 [Thermonema sp.]